MKYKLILVLCIFLFAGCGAKDPYAYRSSDGKFRPINDPSHYTKQQIRDAKKSYKKSYQLQQTESNVKRQNETFPRTKRDI